MRNMKFYVNGLCHVALDGQKNLLIFRYIDLQKKAALGRQRHKILY